MARRASAIWARCRLAVAQPQMTFGGDDLYPSLEQKAAALCFSRVANHPVVDGNKRVAHAAMETFLMLNGSELDAPTAEQERMMLSLAAGQTSRDTLPVSADALRPWVAALRVDTKVKNRGHHR